MQRKRGFYEKYVKRLLDIVCSLLAIIVFGWLYIIIAVLVRIKMGSPVVFKQPRPGLIDPKTGKERIFGITGIKPRRFSAHCLRGMLGIFLLIKKSLMGRFMNKCGSSQKLSG